MTVGQCSHYLQAISSRGLLWFTCRREYCKFRTYFENSKSKSCSRNSDEYWNRKVDREEAFDSYLSAISALVEDAPEIVLLVYIIGSGVQQETLGKV